MENIELFNFVLNALILYILMYYQYDINIFIQRVLNIYCVLISFRNILAMIFIDFIGLIKIPLP